MFLTGLCVALGVTVSGAIRSLTERILPYDGSPDCKRIEHQQENAVALEKMRERFQEKSAQQNADLQKSLAEFNRHTAMMVAEFNAYYNLKSAVLMDNSKNFPLNISPFCILANNHLDINYLLNGPALTDEKTADCVLNALDKRKPLSVFITPIQIDSRVHSKEAISAQVFDVVYSSVESLFLNEYSRNSERPVIFYASAWNKNANGGLHAAEELYFYLKDLPTLLIEPRYDGKTLKITFSCWGLGYSVCTHIRQELVFNMDWNSILISKIYERSKKMQSDLSKVDSKNKMIMDLKKMCQHNVELYEKLDMANKISQHLSELQENGRSTVMDDLGDYVKFFYTTRSDSEEIAELIASTLGMVVSALSDVHHLLASDVSPKLPQIYEKYFSLFDHSDVREKLIGLYDQVYGKLLETYPDVRNERSLDYLQSTMVLSSPEVQERNILLMLCQYTSSEPASMEVLLERLDQQIKEGDSEGIAFLDRMYVMVNQSSIPEKANYLESINDLIRRKGS